MADATLAAVERLIATVARLREPERGCPWDLAQTNTSLIPCVLEEAHEVADALRHGTNQDVAEELGDLLLQVLLQAQIGEQEQRFTLLQICNAIHHKLVRRHPHVFSTARVEDEAAARKSWNAVKAREAQARGEIGLSRQLEGKARSLPALAAAMAVSRKVAAAGFDWPTQDAVWDKVDEELSELRAAKTVDEARAELGDLLFTLVNIARWQGLDPEEALAGTNRRFLQRFAHVEAALDHDLERMAAQDTDTLQALWQRAKQQTAGSNPP